MGVIRTKLVIEGEAEYRKAISACNSELKALGSGLALIEQQCEGTANSVSALTAKQENLTKQAEVQKEKLSVMQTALENSKRAMKEAADESEKLKFQIEDAASALEKIDQNSENAAERQEALKTRIKDLNVELEKNEDRIQKLHINTSKWQDSTNKAQKELNDMQAELAANARYLEKASSSADSAASSIDSYGNAVEKSSEALPGLNQNISIIQNGLQQISKAFDGLQNNKQFDFLAIIGGIGNISSAIMQAGGAYINWIKETSAELQKLKREQEEIAVSFELTMNKTKAQAESMTSDVNKIYTAGISDSKEEIAEAVVMVKRFMNLSGEAGKTAAEKMLLIKKYFGEDFSEQMNAVNAMMQRFGLNAESAMDAVVYGMQNVKDGRGELLDVFAEYSSAFQRLGYNAEHFILHKANKFKAAKPELEKTKSILRRWIN